MAAENIYDLNDHCISKIFEYLHIDDLMRLCSTTKRFRQIVLTDVVPRMPINIDLTGRESKYCPFELLEVFGKTMTKIIFSGFGCELEGFLLPLLLYCTPKLLTEVELWHAGATGDRPILQELVAETATYFENVVVLSINYINTADQWLPSIPNKQIHSLQLQTDHFNLSADLFPNLRHLTIQCNRNERFRTDEKYWPSCNATADFIRGKSNLKTFFYEGFEDEMIFKTVAKHCANVGCLGVIKINSDSDEGTLNRKWKVLNEFKHLESISLEVSVINCKDLNQFFNMLSSLDTIKNMKIRFLEIGPDWMSDENRDEYISSEILALVKTNVQRKVQYLEYLEMVICDRYAEIPNHLNYVLAFAIDVKTINIRMLNDPFNPFSLRVLVRNIRSLENLFIDHLWSHKWKPTESISTECYRELMMEKIMINNRLGTSKVLTIFVDIKVGEQLKQGLGNDYDPQIIAVENISKFGNQVFKGDIF